jgi:AraC-like DNA-binding protein
LLGATDAPVKQIAFSLGFADVRGMRRTILRHVGMTPSAIRRKGLDADGANSERPRLYFD